MPVTTDNFQNQSVSLGMQANAGIIRLLSAQDMGASFVSAVIDMSAFNSTPDLSVEFNATGAPTGTFTWEVSNAYDAGSNAGATFVTVPDAKTDPSLAGAAPAGAAKQYIGSFSRAGIGSARFARLRYVRSSGAGAVDCWVYVRGVAR
jgi:hypothetical protein